LTPWRLLCRATGLTGLFPRSALCNGEAMGGWQRESEREVDIVTGCLLLTTAQLWRRLGGFDPVFFMYGEEGDLCLRARHLGARPAMTPEATIIHYGGASEATRAGKLVKVLAAKATLIERHFPLQTRRLGLALNAGWPLGRWLALAASGHISGRADVQARARVWQEIWQRRAEWRNGYAQGATEALLQPAISRG
jgi:hypothetical protein